MQCINNSPLIYKMGIKNWCLNYSTRWRYRIVYNYWNSYFIALSRFAECWIWRSARTDAILKFLWPLVCFSLVHWRIFFNATIHTSAFNLFFVHDSIGFFNIVSLSDVFWNAFAFITYVTKFELNSYIKYNCNYFYKINSTTQFILLI